MSVKWLGERLHLDSGTLTPLLKRLESDGVAGAQVRVTTRTSAWCASI